MKKRNGSFPAGANGWMHGTAREPTQQALTRGGIADSRFLRPACFSGYLRTRAIRPLLYLLFHPPANLLAFGKKRMNWRGSFSFSEQKGNYRVVERKAEITFVWQLKIYGGERSEMTALAVKWSAFNSVGVLFYLDKWHAVAHRLLLFLQNRQKPIPSFPGGQHKTPREISGAWNPRAASNNQASGGIGNSILSGVGSMLRIPV
jgi:hypothetical protein